MFYFCVHFNIYVHVLSPAVNGVAVVTTTVLVQSGRDVWKSVVESDDGVELVGSLVASPGVNDISSTAALVAVSRREVDVDD